MSDVPVAEAPEAEATTPAPEATPDAPEATEPEAPESVPEADPKLKEVQREAQGLRKRLRDAETALQAAKDAELSEVEQAKQRADRAEEALATAAEKAKRSAVSAAVAVEASKHGLDAALAAKLVRDDVEFDDNDEPTNVAALVESIVKQHPQLTAKPAPDAGLPANAPGGPQPPESDADRLARIYGSGNDPTRDLALNAALGGGVIVGHGTGGAA